MFRKIEAQEIAALLATEDDRGKIHMRSGPIAHWLFFPGGQQSVASRQLFRNPEHSSEKRRNSCNKAFKTDS